MKLLNPSIKVHQKLFVERYFDSITFEMINDELNEKKEQIIAENTDKDINTKGNINETFDGEIDKIENNNENKEKLQMITISPRDLLIKGENKLKLRLMCDTKFEIPSLDSEFKQFFTKSLSFQNIMNCCSNRTLNGKTMNSEHLSVHNDFDTVLLHFHGGGFVSQSSGTHQIYTRELNFNNY